MVPISISIKLRFPAEIVAQTGGALLDVVAKNNTDHPIEVLRAVGLGYPAKGDYYIEVRHLHGSLVPVRERYKDIYVNGDVFMSGIYRVTTIAPHDKLVELVSLLDLIDFDLPGIYVVIAKRKLPASLGGGWVTSNALQFTMPKLPDNPFGDPHYEPSPN